MKKRPILRLRPREGRRARAGAPWIFSNEITIDAATRGLAPGAPVDVEGDDGRKFGVGYYNANSLIAVRLFEAPPGTEIDQNFFAERFHHALALREALYDLPFYRLVHAEGDRLPGVVIDRYGDSCIVQITTAGMEALADVIVEALEGVIAPANIIIRADAPVRELEGLGSYVRAALGEMPARVALEENGARYFVDTKGGQKTGWYFDQRDNRTFVAALAAGRSVLDVYCHTGGFALAAAHAGAKDATGLDSSAAVLALAQDAAAANGLSSSCRFVKADAAQELERLGAANEQFDLVVCDPPPFVRSRKDLESGARAYRRLARLAAQVTAPGGFLMLASCSHNIPTERFRVECATGIARAGRRASLIREAGASPDHPIHPMLPETAYLKVLAYAVE
ncbi:MAG TPA: class I SAM-dependent rRNA methyltransferase [Rhizomicrobium sp.]|jgi:23S rRNA (cytosine1962-C5)-methyltransferase|nr:class I SAM-dependent rRNA methyltransferase [Rhizomicrobium sp.]